ncbi:MAG: aminoacyl-tRNA hydrolase [Candidatus Saganbacteria bacterium]|nr:aminoacyl-tRNA hydrolase [Candidatus Saganbacteria bacterium]
MYLIIGLGNPGDDYKDTRHNVGFEVVETFAKNNGIKLSRNSSFMARAGKGKLGEEDIIACLPMTYMNRSGESVAKMAKKNDIQTGSIIVVHDEFDLDIGILKIKKGGGSAGHNGVRSVIDSLHDDSFIRIRIGIGKPGHKNRGADFVLSKMNRHLAKILKETTQRASCSIEDIIGKGLSHSMNEYNKPAA